ncbi:hypothetical protein KBT16_13935 [Nostoc sp. CCCryo 231-06]|nr:hypothetical protein [Nostoc sp. CCCryo 231-06]
MKIEEEFRSQNSGVRINTSLREAAPTTGSVQVSRGFRLATATLSATRTENIAEF